jgi:hypothetical protein
MKRLIILIFVLLINVCTFAVRIPSGSTDRDIAFAAVDGTDLKTRETGLTSFTAYYTLDDSGTATAMTTPTVAELSSSNMPGVYMLSIDESGMTTLTAGHDTEELVIHITHASMAPVTRVIEIYRPDTTEGQTVTVAGGRVEANVTYWAGTAAVDGDADGRPDTDNTDKAGYSLTQSFPTNFADMAITASTGEVAGDMVKVSGDGPAADSLESMLDGTGGGTLELEYLNVNSDFYANTASFSSFGTHSFSVTGGMALTSSSGPGLTVGTTALNTDAILATGTGTGHGMHLVAVDGAGMYTEGKLAGIRAIDLDGPDDFWADRTGNQTGVIWGSWGETFVNDSTIDWTTTRLAKLAAFLDSGWDDFWEMTEDDAGARRYTSNALEQAPAGGGGGTATLANQTTIMDDLALVKSQTDKFSFSGSGPYDVKATLDGEQVVLAPDGLDYVSTDDPPYDVSTYTFRDMVHWLYGRYAYVTIWDSVGGLQLRVRNSSNTGDLTRQPLNKAGNVQTIGAIQDGAAD